MDAFYIAANRNRLRRQKTWLYLRIGGTLFTLVLVLSFVGVLITPASDRRAYQDKLNAYGLASVELGGSILKSGASAALKILGLGKKPTQELPAAEPDSARATPPPAPRSIS